MSNDAAEKTEDATTRRLDKEREKGNISKSQDLNSALIITLGLALIGTFSAYILNKLQTTFTMAFTNLNPANISETDILVIFQPYAKAAGQIILPFLLILMFAGMLIIRLQTGNVFAPSKIKLDFSRLSMNQVLQGAKRLFNPVDPKTLVEFVKSLLKLIIVFSTGFSVLNSRKEELFALLGVDLSTAFVTIGSILSQMLINMCIAMIIIGLFDKKFQDYQYNKSLKMTKQEVKDEMKDIDGDPKVKARVRSIRMQMMQQRMMSSVPQADVVVTNPTHFSVALKYDREKSVAPIVVAKGVDFIAFKIREIAKNNNVPIVENPPLARALYKTVPIDGIIPSDMFVAVAEVLAYVYNKDKK